ncbi:TonB-dependent receptor [Fulvivirga sediminis]|uniref:TonB-dependent receptor n=1 Tax=Fulvivirga sediminis TaxID=2803949 RepID=A0A937FA76_9BACT|nr:TonB-dependent receptor [Fulvivirga sediminis]MBL3656863.1 TonB-dependent receptor [Fulvivirga sediminis]
MRLSILTVMLLSIMHAYGQNSVTGRVTDKETNEVLPGATVRLSNRATATASDGTFSFKGVTKGKYYLKVTFVGYESQEQMLIVGDGDVNVEISLNEETLVTDEVVVSSTRANEDTPTTYSNLSKEDIEENNLGQDLPYVLNMTPSLVTTSDAGAGVGYTGLRIRGSDATRINVTINGVPLNDSESQGVFWVDIPDIASSTQSIQVQRGVGTSTNGGGAFGGTINLQTNSREMKPYAELINSVGSYDTWRHTLGFGTGLIKDHWSFDGRLSKINSDGYIDRAKSDLDSYYLSGGYYGEKTMVKAIMFGGKERTYQSWYGTPQAVLENDREGIEEVIANNGVTEEEAENLREGGRTFNWYLYDDQVDDYKQDHYQLHVSQSILPNLVGNVSLHYTYGRGYYEEYKSGENFTSYALPTLQIGDSVISSTDLVRRRWLDNDFYGATTSFEYVAGNLTLNLGGAYNEYRGDHFGEVIWAEFAPTIPNDYRYYDNDGVKKDGNVYLKANYAFDESLHAFVDVQYRSVNYEIEGIDNDLRTLDMDNNYNFFNPKLGFVYDLKNRSKVYASYSVANREPVRTDFVDSPSTPKHETLYDLEAGYKYESSDYQFSANYYYMDYSNQLVLTGALNDVGSSLRTNVEDSYRMGVELVGSARLTNKLYWQLNATFSRNKISNFTEVFYDYGSNWDQYNEVQVEHEDSDIAFSPNVIAGSQLSFLPLRDVKLSLLSKYVGKQYLDNTSNDNRSIDAYFVNDLRATYTVRTDFIKEINFTFQVNNIFEELYSSNGYTFGYAAGDYEVRENYYYPQATRNFMASLSLKF